MKEEISILNSDSEGKIDIVDGYFIVEDPIIITWGLLESRYQYSVLMAIIEYLPEKSIGIFREFSDHFTNKSLINYEPEIQELLKHFVPGEYRISKKNESISDKSSFGRFVDYNINYPIVINKSEENKKFEEYKKYYNSREGYRAFNIIDKTTEIAVCLSPIIIALHKKDLEFENRVRKYEKQIQNGKYPFCLVISHFLDCEDSSLIFSLECTSKLKAYKNLKIDPRIIEIKKIENPTKYDDLEFLKLFFSKIYSWQSKSIFKSRCQQNKKFPFEVQNHHDHPFHSYIKQGEIKDYWPNGQLKSVGFYHLNIPHGLVQNYFANGQIKSIWFYNDKGEKTRPIKTYYETGHLASEFIFSDGDEFGTNKTYRIDGSLSEISYYYDGVYAIFKNGKYYLKDGKSQISYHENGNESYAAYYKNGKKINWEKFDINGKLINEMKNSV